MTATTACKNTIVLIIAILGYSEIYTEILDIGMKIVRSSDCRLGDNRDANGVLAEM